MSSGTLPAGITLNASTGVLAGTPTATGTASYTIKVTNSGQIALTGATFTDPLSGVLDDATYNNDAAATAGTVSFASPNLTWTGNLAIAATATITFTVTVGNPDTGNQYTITVANTGQTPYTAAQVTDSLASVLGDAVYNNDATASTGTVSYTSPVLTWTGGLNPGQTATIRYSVTVSNPDAGGRFLSNSVVSTAPGSTCPSGSTSPGYTVTVAVVGGVLSITVPASTSLGSAAPGGTITANLGTVQVTDNRGFGANYAAGGQDGSPATGGMDPDRGPDDRG